MFNVEEPFSESTVHESDLPAGLTRLYRIAPAVFSEWGREGLLSFIIRLSREHLVNPRLLIQRIFSEADPQIAVIAKNRFYVKDSRTINAVGEYARLFSAVAGQLTGRNDLQYLTMLPWKDILPENGEALTAKKLKWCPCCLAEQALKLGYNYHPLLWSLELYKVCMHHACSMQDSCPRCAKPQPFIPSLPDLGHCTHCGVSLLSMSTYAPDRERVDSSFKVESVLHSMLENQQRNAFSLDMFRKNIALLIQHRADGNKASFCRDLGLDPWAVNSWLHKGQRPTLQRLVAIGVKHQVPIVALLIENGIGKEDGERGAAELLRRITRKARPQISASQRAKISVKLNEELNAPVPRSVNAACRELGLSRSALKYWFPTLCQAIGQRYKDFLAEKGRQSKAAREQILTGILAKFAENGIRPSRRIVDKHLRPHGLALARSDLGAVYHQWGDQLKKL